MRFIIVLVSLLMISFGMMFLVTVNDSGGLEKIKEKVGYEHQSEEGKNRIDNYITKFGNRVFVAMIFGICLFIASLFL